MKALRLNFLMLFVGVVLGWRLAQEQQRREELVRHDAY
jgi:hypothetical protein